MPKTRIPVVTIVTTFIISFILYEPVTLFFYKITEPRFRLPIKAESRKIFIRNDAYGEGNFGAKRRNGRAHSGIDIQVPVGTPVYASKSGVTVVGNVPQGYGKYVMILHPDGFQTMYGHLSGWNVVSGQKVRRGDLIGYVGKTGNAALKAIEAHLHFEIRKHGEPIDPKGLLK